MHLDNKSSPLVVKSFGKPQYALDLCCLAQCCFKACCLMFTVRSRATRSDSHPRRRLLGGQTLPAFRATVELRVSILQHTQSRSTVFVSRTFRFPWLYFYCFLFFDVYTKLFELHRTPPQSHFVSISMRVFSFTVHFAIQNTSLSFQLKLCSEC